MGIISNTGIVYLAQTLKSLQQLKTTLPISKSHARKIPVHIITNDSSFKSNLASSIDYSSIDNMTEALLKSPFRRTLFLDPSKIIVEDLSGLFNVLDRFEFAVLYKSGESSALDNCVPSFDDNILLYRRDKNVINFIEQWGKGHKQKNNARLKNFLFESKLRFHILPPEYNVCQKEYLNLWTIDEARPKIIDQSIMDTNELEKLKIGNKSLYQQLRTTKHKLQRIWHELRYSA